MGISFPNETEFETHIYTGITFYCSFFLKSHIIAVVIPEELLEAKGARIISLPKDSFLFMEGDLAQHYYQIKTGKIKMVNHNDDGKEFVQGYFEDGQSFGEPPLFKASHYPASAFGVKATELYKLPRDMFLDLLRDNFEVHLQFTTKLAQRMMYKAMMMKEISSHDPEHRILSFIDYIKKESQSEDKPFTVNLTRQQMADLLGIRVETIIRSVKNLAEKGELSIVARKIIR